MTGAGEVHCMSCGLDITAGTKERRKLSSPASQGVCRVLEDIISRVHVLEPAQCRVVNSGYVCKKCYRNLERLGRMRGEVEDTIMRACDTVRKAIPYITDIPTASTVQTLPIPDSADEPPPAKRQRLSTDVSADCVTSQLPQNSGLAKSSSTPSVSVTIGYAQPKRYVLTPKRKGLCKSLARRNHAMLAKRCLQDSNIREYVIKGVGQILLREVSILCSNRGKSILRDKSNIALEKFNWKDIHDELCGTAPILVKLLKGALPRCSNQHTMISIIISLLCKSRNSSVCLFQRLMSIILYSGHASKRVFQRLHKVNLCMSHQSTIRLLDAMGKDFDLQVMEWKNAVGSELLHKTRLSNVDTNGLSGWVDSQSDQVVRSASQQALSPSLSESPTTTPLPPSTTPLIHNSQPESSQSSMSEASCSSNSTDIDLDLSLSQDPEREDVLPSQNSVTDPECEDAAVTDSDVMSSVTPGNDNLLADVGEVLSPPHLYKFVFDNIDKDVKPRDMRSDAQTHSLHYVQVYAVRSRIDFTSLSTIPKFASDEVCIFDILPSEVDYKELQYNFSIHVARILTDHIPFFKDDFTGLLPKHISHKYSKEMSFKSNVVPLGVLPKNETKYEDMIDILTHIQGYVPCNTYEKEFVVGDDVVCGHEYNFIPALVGGDQLSVARARGGQDISLDGNNGYDKLNGLLPVAEDWHAKLCFMEVINTRLCKTSSCLERGTLYQLRNVLNRRNVPTTVKKNVNAYEDFLQLVTTAHVLTASMQHLQMETMRDLPSDISQDIWMKDDNIRRKELERVSLEIVNKFCDLSLTYAPAADSNQAKGTAYSYACETLSLGLLLMEYQDAIREGDGDRVMRVWKYLFLIFKATGHSNYAIEAFTLLCQYHFMLSPFLAEQLKWSRFVNTHGKIGKNISMDMHMEHLNRVCKTAISGLGSNKAPNAILRVGKTVGVLDNLLTNFDSENNVSHNSDYHTSRSIQKDLDLALKELQGRFSSASKMEHHRSFPNLVPNLITKIKENDLKVWMINHIEQLL